MKYEIEVKKVYTIEADSVDEAFDKLNERIDGETTLYIKSAE